MSEEKEPLISFEKADIKGGDETVIYGLTMDVNCGDFIYITGKVGTGKTSIIKTVTAEKELAGGECHAFGFDLQDLRRRDIPKLRRQVGVIFQDLQLLVDRTVEDNLDFVLRATGWKDKAKRAVRIDEVLGYVGMETKRHRMPHQLSGGEQQRICIARALLNSPKVILADEPTGHLDGETAASIMELFKRINTEEGTAIVMVTHDRSLLERYPGRVFECENESCTER